MSVSSILLLLVFLAGGRALAEEMGTFTKRGGEPIILKRVGTDFIEVSWERKGNWSGITSFFVTYTGPSPTLENCTCSHPCLNSPLCLFTSCSNCKLKSCSSYDLTVQGGGHSSPLADITTAPPAISENDHKVEFNDGKVKCSWKPSSSSSQSQACHNRTLVKITTANDERSYTMPHIILAVEKEEKLGACDNGKVTCAVKALGGSGGESLERSHTEVFSDKGSLVEKINLKTHAKSINVSWTVSTPCSRLEKFHIYWDPDNLSGIHIAANQRQHLIEGLTPCTNYNVTIQPLREDNLTLAKPMSDSGTTDILVLEAPSSLEAEAKQNATLNVKWTPPNPWGNLCPLNKYSLYWTSLESLAGNGSHPVSANESSYILAGLLPCTNYKLQISALNVAGESQLNHTLSATKTEVLNAPTDVKVQNETSRELIVSWSAPNKWGAACKIEGYNVSWHGDSIMEGKTSLELPQNVTTSRIQNLVPCTNYSILVQAKNIAGLSEAGMAESATLLEVLTPPSNLTEVVPTESSITVAWNQTEWGSLCPLLKFSISWNSAVPFTGNGSTTVDSTSRNHMIDNLKACTNYSIEIRSVNSVGHSNSTIIPSGTKPMLPAAPLLTCDEQSDHFSLLLHWTIPENNNCTKSYRIDYTGFIRWSSEWSNKTATTKSLNFIIRDLIPWTHYTICVAGDTGYINGLGMNKCCKMSTIQDQPGEPANFTSEDTQVNGTSVTLKWEKPKELNGALKGYELAWRSVTHDSGAKNYSEDTTEATIHDLLPNTTYNFTLRAMNGAGFGEPKYISLTTGGASGSGGSGGFKIKPLGIILSVVGGVLLIIIIVAVVVYLKKCRGS